MDIVATGQEPLPLRAWAATRLLIWYFATQLLVAIILLLPAALSSPQSTDGTAPVPPDELLTAFAIAMPCAGLVMLYRVRKVLRSGSWTAILAALGWRSVQRSILICSGAAGAALAAFYVFVAIPYLFPPSVHDASAFSQILATSSLRGRIIVGLAAVLVAPPFEEFLFRGVLLAGFGASWGLWPGIAASTSLFALAHLDQVGRYWPAFLGVIVVALVAMALRLRYRSLAPGIVFHVCYNAVVMTLVVASAT